MSHLNKDRTGAVNTAILLGMVIFVLIAAVVYPLVGDRVSGLTNASSEDYVGEDSASLVGMIPLFYWLAILLVVIGTAIAAIKEST